MRNSEVVSLLHHIYLTFDRRIPWSTVSNAFFRSRKILILSLRLSMFENHVSVTLISEVRVLCNFRNACWHFANLLCSFKYLENWSCPIFSRNLENTDNTDMGL